MAGDMNDLRQHLWQDVCCHLMKAGIGSRRELTRQPPYLGILGPQRERGWEEMADTRERERQWYAWWMRKKEKDGVWEVEEELGVKAGGREREKTQTREKARNSFKKVRMAG